MSLRGLLQVRAEAQAIKEAFVPGPFGANAVASEARLLIGASDAVRF